MTREELPKGEVLCDYCTAKCCKYFALPLPDHPKQWSDFEEIRWFLAHEDVNAFVDEGAWYLLVNRPCRHLQPNNRCGIYENRPNICREYSTDNCEYDDHYLYEKIFEHDSQIEEYAEALFGPRPAFSKE
jgi:Fe-S-cluster containining protein